LAEIKIKNIEKLKIKKIIFLLNKNYSMVLKFWLD
jgi:hypothetical protein